MTTETFGGGHGAPSTVAFYSPDQKRNVLGEFDKEDGSGETTDWEKAKGMTVGQWDAMSDKERASLLAAVYVADADKKPGASAALAKLRGWVAGGKDRKKAGAKASSDAKKNDDKKKREAEAAKKKADADKKRAESARNARRVRPDSVNSSHPDGYIIGESEDKNTRMRWDKEHSTYVVEKKDGGKWKEARRLSPEQAYNEFAKANSDWFRPAVQPYLKPATSAKPATATPAAKPGTKPTVAKPAAAKPGTTPSGKPQGTNEGVVTKPDHTTTAKPGQGHVTTPARTTPDRTKPGQGHVTKPKPRARKKTALTAAAEVHTGAMIALIPREDITASLAVDGGEEAEQLHMTEVYLGQIADIPDDEQFRIIDVMSDFASRQYEVNGDAFSVNLFNPPGAAQSDGKDRDACVTLGISGHDIAAFHDELVDALERAGVEYPEQHAPRVPHITLVYTDDADLSYFTDKTGPITFDTLRLAFGGQVFDIPLGEGRDDDLTAGGAANFKFDPRQPRDGEGQWTDVPGSGAVKDAIEKMAKPKDSASLWKNRKDYVGKVIATRRGNNGRLIMIEGPKGPVIRPESQMFAYDENRKLVPTGEWNGEDDGYSDIKSAKKLREAVEDAPPGYGYQFIEPEEAHPGGSPYDKVAPEAPAYVEPEEPETSQPGYDPSEWDNLPESDAPDGWAEGSSDPEIMPKERRATKSWSELQRNAFYGYTVDASTYNNTFRDSKGKKAHKDEMDGNGVMIREATDAIDSAMYPLPRDMTVFRQATINAFGVNSLEELKSLDGQTVKDFGYVSTSVNFKQNLPNGTSAGRIHIKIDVPKGKKAAYIGDVSSYPEQNELLLARNSRMKIQSVEFKNGFAFVTMKVV